MSEQVKQSIDARRNAILNSYSLDGELRAKMDGLFAEIEKLGAECKDAGDFETKFAASPLNTQYMNLFTEIATASVSGSAGGAGVDAEGFAASAAEDTVAGMAGGMAAGAAEEAARMAVRSVTGGAVPTTRAAANQKVYDAARDIPVVGDAIDLGQKASYAKHLGKMFGFGKKKDKEE